MRRRAGLLAVSVDPDHVLRFGFVSTINRSRSRIQARNLSRKASLGAQSQSTPSNRRWLYSLCQRVLGLLGSMRTKNLELVEEHGYCGFS